MQKINGRFGAVARVTALMGMMLAAALTASAQTFTTLHSFDSGDGAHPNAGLIQAPDGNLYGTTSFGGEGGSTCFSGCGTIFQIAPRGTLTTFYSFCSQGGSCTDGAG